MIKINNWSSYQSYKDRKPPWIRLHRSLLDNYEYQSMSADARALLPMLWLLASEDEDPLSGLIRYGPEKISFRLRMPLDKVMSAVEELSRTNNSGESFIQLIRPCNESVHETLRIRNETVTPETETETETDNTLSPSGDQPVMGGFSPDDMVRIWNEEIDRHRKVYDGEKDLPKVIRLSPDRRRQSRVRIKSLALTEEKWRDVMAGIFSSRFLCGVNDRGWVANYDWIVRSDKNILRIVEGW